MAETTSESTSTGSSEGGSEDDRRGIEQIGRRLDEWRATVDELMVQIDLAHLEARDELRSRFDAAQNAYLAARSRLSDARDDADSNLRSLRVGLEQLLRDLGAAYTDAEAAARRSGQK
jgi:hypothetical protein